MKHKIENIGFEFPGAFSPVSKRQASIVLPAIGRWECEIDCISSDERYEKAQSKI
jgi:hypothetical protein